MRAELFAVRREMTRRAFDEAYVSAERNTVFIHRHCAASGETIVLAAHTAFKGNHEQSIGVEFLLDR